MTTCQATPLRTSFSCYSPHQPWQAEKRTRRQDVRKDLDDWANWITRTILCFAYPDQFWTTARKSFNIAGRETRPKVVDFQGSVILGVLFTALRFRNRTQNSHRSIPQRKSSACMVYKSGKEVGVNHHNCSFLWFLSYPLGSKPFVLRWTTASKLN